MRGRSGVNSGKINKGIKYYKLTEKEECSKDWNVRLN